MGYGPHHTPKFALSSLLCQASLKAYTLSVLIHSSAHSVNTYQTSTLRSTVLEVLETQRNENDMVPLKHLFWERGPREHTINPQK